MSAAGRLPLVEELTPVPDVAEALCAFAELPGVIFFDSARTGDPGSRYSFLAADPIQVEILRQPVCGHDPFAALRLAQQKYATPRHPDLPPFQGGLAGYLGYELGRCWERLPSAVHDELAMPVLAVGVYDWVVAWDHQQQRAWIIAHGFGEESPDDRPRCAAKRLTSVRETLQRGRSGGGGSNESQVPHVSVVIESARHSVPFLPGLTSNFSRETYEAAVASVIEAIRAGDIFQANLSQRFLCPAPASSLDLYLRLRSVNAAPFAGYFAMEDWSLLSASPERFLQLEDNVVSTRPIKGTRQRRPFPEADLFTQDDLQVSEKDIAENVMIVDLLRNDLSRVCRPGSIRVPELCTVSTYETVHHLVSEVVGELEPGRNVWDVFAATFPGGSITGAPKVRAMEIITEHEQVARGPYCGSLFYVGFDGTMDSSILIRTMTSRYGWLQFQAGGGIVAQSYPGSEYEETLHKAEGLLRALR